MDPLTLIYPLIYSSVSNIIAQQSVMNTITIGMIMLLYTNRNNVVDFYNKYIKKKNKICSRTLERSIFTSLSRGNNLRENLGSKDYTYVIFYVINYIKNLDSNTLKDNQIYLYNKFDQDIFYSEKPIVFDDYVVTVSMSYSNNVNTDHGSKLLDFNGNITITSLQNSYKDIEKFIEVCRNYWNKYNNDNLLQSQKYIVQEVNNGSYFLYDFNTNKTFDNLFFEQKDQLIKNLDNFMNYSNNKINIKRGLKQSLSLMLYGPPGTGKTSTIKAIAKYTDRHIINVKIYKDTNMKHLRVLFLGNYVGDYYIPFDKRMYIFEEVDCGSLKDLFLKRVDKKEKLKQDALLSKDLAIMKEYKAMFEDELKITQGDLLEFFDGLLELNALIIMTTNKIDEIDPAFLRKGRTDMLIEYKNMRVIDICNKYKVWFDNEIPKEIVKCMKDYTFTEAQVTNLFISEDIELIHTKLKNNDTK